MKKLIALFLASFFTLLCFAQKNEWKYVLNAKGWLNVTKKNLTADKIDSIKVVSGVLYFYKGATPLTLSGGMVYPAAGIPLSTGSGFGSSITNNSSNWNTAYSDRNKWDGGSTGLVASTARASLGASTVGSSFFQLSNPGAITFPRINADNSVSALTAAQFKTAIGASDGTSDAAVRTAINDSINDLRSNALQLSDYVEFTADSATNKGATKKQVRDYVAANGGGTSGSLPELSTNPASGNIYIHTGDRKIHYLAGGVWHRVAILDSVTNNQQNLVLYSEDLSNAAWVKVRQTIATNQANDMNGSPTMDLTTVSSDTWAYIEQSSIPVVASTDYTLSFDVKRATQATEYQYIIKNESSGDAIISSVEYYSSTSSSVSRVTHNFTTPAGCTLLKLSLIILPAVGDNVYLGRIQIAETGKDYITTTNARAE